jgi:transcriptional regulator with XRE-family HTH domain
MNLADYLNLNNISQREFADRSGLSTPTVSLLARGAAVVLGGKPIGVSLATKNKLVEASDGAITDDDFKLRQAVYEWAVNSNGKNQSRRRGRHR